ncbi:phosphatase PAP2 family protein [bacterium]|nr:phosphatase PAP2 family protein [bacterium]
MTKFLILLFFLVPLALPWETSQKLLHNLNCLGEGATQAGLSLLLIHSEDLFEDANLQTKTLGAIALLSEKTNFQTKSLAAISLLVSPSCINVKEKIGDDCLNALLTTGTVTLGLKYLTHSKRPNGESYDSFPSGHTSTSFAIASVLSRYHPENKLIYYLLATGVAIARVQSGAHHTIDVIGGAIVGLWGGKMALEGKGILPFIKKNF